MNLGFVILYTQDVSKAKAFYADRLGMSVVEASSGPTFVVLRPEGGSLIALQDKSERLSANSDALSNTELSFEVTDVDGIWKRWQANGVEIVSEPMDLPFGRYFLAKDPEGHFLSVYRLKQ